MEILNRIIYWLMEHGIWVYICVIASIINPTLISFIWALIFGKYLLDARDKIVKAKGIGEYTKEIEQIVRKQIEEEKE